ncbi:TolC family protein [Sphingomonas sp. KC8]|uniref:TolC family protein n=1 Tax=Sphingomonas sp. KC8 TaxID=1030157 RepID=UPI000248B57F|nr:TolC family protein [Sphingomonas sp. KC8]ARS26967.1 transporter [Sphingomonas sp. KC8]
MRRGASWLLGGALLFAAPAHAQTAPAFGELLVQAQSSSPRLSASGAEIEAARGQADQASARPNPTLRTEVENFAGQRPFQGWDRSETTIAVEQSLELGGKRPARVAAARADVTTAEARAHQARINFAHELAVAYATAEASAARVSVTIDALDLAESDARVARLLVENGREARVRSLQAVSAVTSARADLASARAEAEAALARLSALSAAQVPFTAVAGGLLDATLPLPGDTDRESPSVQLARAERDAALRRTESERRRGVPDLTVSLGARRLEEEDATAMVAGLSVPLPFFDRNRGNVATASANARAAESRLAEAASLAEADRLSARSRARAADETAVAAREGQDVAAEAYRLARIGYESGKMPLSEVLAARRTLIEARSRAVDARLARVQAMAEFARVQGLTLAGELR